jgi:Ankyrin repeats (3 copies)
MSGRSASGESSSEEQHKHRDGSPGQRYTRRVRRYARRNRVDKLRRLWKRTRGGVDLSQGDRRGRTALHLAAEDGACDAADWLLRHGARADAVDAQGDTPAHNAAHWAGHRPELVLAFRTHAPASLHIGDARGRTARDVAAAMLASASAAADAARRRAASSEDADARRAAAEQAAQASARASEWRDRMFDEAELDGDGDGGYYSRWETAEETFGAFHDGDDDDAYEPAPPRRARATRAGDRRQTRREGTPVGDTGEGTPERGGATRGGNVYEEWKRQRQQNAESARILEEERAKDAAWRRRVTAGASLEQQRSVYETSWRDAKHSESPRVDDIPWPVAPGHETDVVQLVLAGVPVSGHRAALRSELKRWHPDRFGARFGAALQAAGDAVERAAWARVNALSNALSDAYQKTSA